MTTLDELADRVRALPKAVLDDSMPEISRALRAALLATINAHETPLGDPWAPRKVGSGTVLDNAGAALKSGYIGRAVIFRLIGVEARHHRGRVKGKTKRQIIPTGSTLPPAMARALEAVITRRFIEVANGQ